MYFKRVELFVPSFTHFSTFNSLLEHKYVKIFIFLHLPSCSLMNNHLSFSSCIFIDLFTKCSSLHMTIWFQYVHRTITVIERSKGKKQKKSILDISIWLFLDAMIYLWWYTYWLLPAIECQCFGPLNQAGKSHRSVGGDRRSVIIRDPT